MYVANITSLPSCYMYLLFLWQRVGRENKLYTS
jgi:hypothetical protein